MEREAGADGEGWTVGRCLSEGAATLARAGIGNARREARLLLAHATGLPQERLLGHPEDRVADPQAFRRIVERRARREPVSHILGRREFWSRPFRVGPDVLDPRPDTETLIAGALDWARARGADHPIRIVDLGIGSGSILLTLLAELPGASGVGVDLSEAALAIARANAVDLGLSSRARLLRGSWGASLTEERFDLVVSNPPYIPSAEIDQLEPEVALHEPRLALDGGADGLLAYRNLMPHAARLVAPDGAVMLELGIGQAAAVGAIGAANGLAARPPLGDLGGVARVLILEPVHMDR